MIASSRQEITLQAPISSVTLYEDRALVSRSLKAYLNSGLIRVKIEKISPIVVDKSLLAKFARNNLGARIDDIRIKRSLLVRDEQKPEHIKEDLIRVRQLLQNFENLSQDREHQQYYFAEIYSIINKAVAEIPVDLSWNLTSNQTWQTDILNLCLRMRSLHEEIFNTYHNQEKLHQLLSDLITKILASTRPDYFDIAFIEADLMIQVAGEYEISIDYIVGNALWRPWHQAYLQEKENTISFRCDGCVWQNTGEDWQDVDLIFSTARASLGVSPPLLSDDYLNIQDKSSKILVETRSQALENTGLGSEQTSSKPELPGIDDGGKVCNLRSSNKVTILSNGRPYRVPLFSFQSEAKIEYVLMPEIAPQVIQKSEQTNTNSVPILAGPVDLIKGTEYVGKTSIMFIAPNEKFALGWGSDGAIRVQRFLEKKEENNFLTGWKTKKIQTLLFISNIGDLHSTARSHRPRNIKIIERVPVSELEQVIIEVIKNETTHEIQPDLNGFCTWNLSLNSYSQKEIHLVYLIKTSGQVVEADNLF